METRSVSILCHHSIYRGHNILTPDKTSIFSEVRHQKLSVTQTNGEILPCTSLREKDDDYLERLLSKCRSEFSQSWGRLRNDFEGGECALFDFAPYARPACPLESVEC